MSSAVVAASLCTWVCLILLAVTRRSVTALVWYQLAGLAAGLAALSVGTPAWILLGVVWIAVRVIIVPAVLRRRLPALDYGVATPGTPQLAIGAAVVLGVFWWALGGIGIDIGALVAAVWLAASRQEVWAQGLLLLTAEIVTGLIALWSASRIGPGVPDLLAALEVVLSGLLIAWLQQRGMEIHRRGPSTEQLTELKG